MRAVGVVRALVAFFAGFVYRYPDLALAALVVIVVLTFAHPNSDVTVSMVRTLMS